jgi:hypothetical protein
MGISLRASGWQYVGEAGGGSWNSKRRPRIDKHPTGPKGLWEKRVENWEFYERPRLRKIKKPIVIVNRLFD